MLHQQIVQEAGKSTAINGETCTAHHMLTGLRDNVNKQLDSIQSSDWMQSEDTSRMAWLSQQFEKIGLHLYSLGDSTLMITSVGAGLARQLPDMRTAKAYLAMMGGAA